MSLGSPFLSRLKERKLVQWVLAYLGGAWVLLEVSDVVGGHLGWPEVLYRGLLILLGAGFFVTIVLAWYHGERGRQRVSGAELLMVAALLIVAGAALSLLRSSAPTRGPTVSRDGDDRPGVAVLPCENMSADAGDAYLAASLHDEILLKLETISSLFSIGRTSVLHYAQAPPPTPQIAAELGVGFVGECSVRKHGDRIRLIFQLLDGRTGGQVWAQDFDQVLTSTNLFDMQRQIALEVALALQARLTPEEEDRVSDIPTRSTEAYELYLQGMEYSRRASNQRENLLLAQTLLERATQTDPEFALAFARLSHIYGRRYRAGHDRSPEILAAQKAAADSALALQPESAASRWAAGWVHYVREEFEEALGDYGLALDVAPNDAEIIADIGWTQRRLENYPEAIAAFETASKLDPRWERLFVDLGGITFHHAHRWAEAVTAFNRALELAPDDIQAAWQKGKVYCSWQGQLDTLRAMVEHTPGMLDEERFWLALYERDGARARAFLGQGPDRVIVAQFDVDTRSLRSAWIHQLQGEERAAHLAFDSARVLLEQWERDHPGDYRVHLGLGYAYAGLGRTADAATRVDMLLKARSRNGRMTWGTKMLAAEVYAAAGMADEALALLGPIMEGPSWNYPCDARFLFTYDPIRGDPRFQALLEKYAPAPGP